MAAAKGALEALGLLIAFVAVAAGVVAYYQTQKSKAVVDILQDTINALKQRNSLYADQVAELTAAQSEMKVRLEVLEREAATLRKRDD